MSTPADAGVAAERETLIETRNDEAVARETMPLRERKVDVGFLVFFFFNLVVVTYQVDMEQIVIDDPNNFEYPVWPLPWVIDTFHTYAEKYDPLLMARPTWYQMMVWVDQLFYGPFYAFAIYAFWKGKDWIRNWCFIWGGLMLMMVIAILGEEFTGPFATDYPVLVTLTNLGWIVVPILLFIRMWRDHPFTRPAAGGR